MAAERICARLVTRTGDPEQRVSPFTCPSVRSHCRFSKCHGAPFLTSERPKRGNLRNINRMNSGGRAVKRPQNPRSVSGKGFLCSRGTGTEDRLGSVQLCWTLQLQGQDREASPTPTLVYSPGSSAAVASKKHAMGIQRLKLAQYFVGGEVDKTRRGRSSVLGRTWSGGCLCRKSVMEYAEMSSHNHVFQRTLFCSSTPPGQPASSTLPPYEVACK